MNQINTNDCSKTDAWSSKFLVHLTFVAFLIPALLPVSDFSLLIQYLANFSVISLVVLFCFIDKGVKNRRFGFFPFLVFFVAFYAILFAPFYDVNFNLLLLNLKCFTLAFFLLQRALPLSTFLRIINYYYCIYLALSVVYWLDFLPFHSMKEMKNEFIVNYGFFSYYVFVGVEGSPTLIGAYSFFIALLNILYSGSRSIVFIAVVIGFISFRNTALIAFLLVIGVYLLIQSYSLINLAVIGAFIVFTILLFYVTSSAFTSYNLVDVVLYKLTHARSMLWGEMLRTMINSYHWPEYLLGGYTAESFEIRFLQIDGTQASTTTSNPHSDILFLVIKWPFMAVMYFLLIFYLIYRAKDARYSCIVLYIVTVSIMNSDIIGLRNPTYLLAFIYFYIASSKSNMLRY